MTDQQQNEETNKTISKWEKSLGRFWNKGKKEKLIKNWTKQLIAQEKKLIEKAEKTKKDAIIGIMMFNAMYVLEDKAGKPYTEQRLQAMHHEKILELLKYYIRELKKDVGE